MWETTDVSVEWRPVLMTEAEAVYMQGVAHQTLIAQQAALRSLA